MSLFYGAIAHLPRFVLLPVLLVLLSGCNNNDATEPNHKTTLTKVQITLEPPANTQANDTIHLVGNINQWQLEGEKAIELKKENGKYVTELVLNDEQKDWSAILFNLVRNKDWSQTAGSLEGKGNCGFIYSPQALPKSLNISFPGWTGIANDASPTQQVASTLTGNVETLPAFDMPELQRKGDIRIFLPPSYQQNRNKTYPVLYMLDGQNLFDNQTAYSVEWQIDEHITALTSVNMLQELIVVGVPNGPKRFNEYIPWDFIDFEGKNQPGQGDHTLQFIQHTLKPYIDSHYRTQPDAQHTGLAGSSLGGLMAVYAAIAYPDLFGFVGAFSPSLTIQNQSGQPALLSGVNESGVNESGVNKMESSIRKNPVERANGEATKQLSDTRIYIDMGYVEYGGYQQVEALTTALIEKGATHITLVKDDLGRHCEQDWSKRFPYAIQWMLGS